MTYLHPPPGDAPVIVMKDVGGYVNEYGAQTRLYFETGREVRLHECRSACTLALSLPNVCVYPSSLLKFHKAYDPNTKIANEDVSDQLMASYPAAVREKLGNLTRQYKVLTGSELIRLGIRDCNTPLSPNYAVARARVRETPANGVDSSFFGGLVAALSPASAPVNPVAVKAQIVRVQTAQASPPPETEPPLPPPRPEDLQTSAPAKAPVVAPQPQPAVAPVQATPASVQAAPAPVQAAPAPLPPPAASNWARPIVGSAPILVVSRFAPFPYRAARKS